MEKGSKIKIKSEIMKSFIHPNSWSERKKGTKTFKPGDNLYHFCGGEPIAAFGEMETAFTDDISIAPFEPAYIYRVDFLEDVVADFYGDDEYRLDLEKVCDSIEIIYIGTVQENRNKRIVAGNSFGASTIFLAEYDLLDGDEAKKLNEKKFKELKEKDGKMADYKKVWKYIEKEWDWENFKNNY